MVPAVVGTFALAHHKQSLAHIAYFVTILIKGFFGLLEVTLGLIVAVTGSARLHALILEWTDPALYEGGRSDLAAMLREAASGLVQAQNFIVLYLLVHGALKMAITITLLRGRGVWIFPFAITILVGFILYMSYELSVLWSNLLLFLALMDVVTVALVINEWRTWKEHPHPAIKELQEELTHH
ncbi:hypothetical protein AYO42_06250 [Rhizomicrobium sp. SCGC AG-212-E05]|nr:hypothetical protein AYO42_06250 [Rhizomicrobium sp. SCGC AG-212-E05]